MTQGEGRLLGGRYRLEGVLGRGGMGTVWRARDEVLGRVVAVKEVITPRGLDDDARDVMHKRMLREARAAARLSHPGIVTVHDVVEEDGVPWIVMEFVDARSLQEVLDADGPLPEDRVADIGRQILGALRAAHQAGILHRDVKPANVMLSEDRAILTDFGIAQMEGDASLTQTGIVMGSPAFIAPERAQGIRPGPPADLWALGALLFAAVEGKPPFERPDVLSTLAAVMMEPIPPFARIEGLAPVITGLLEKDPEARLDAAAAAELLHRAEAPRSTRAEMTSFDQTRVAALAPTAAVRAPVAQDSARTGITYDNLYRPARDESETRPAAFHVPAPPVPAQRVPAQPSRDEQWIQNIDQGRPPAPKKRGTGLSIILGVVVGVAAVLIGLFVVLDQMDKKENGPKSPATSVTLVTDKLGNRTLQVPEGWNRAPAPKGGFRWKDPVTPAYVQWDAIGWTGTPREAALSWEKAYSKKVFLTYEHVGLTTVTGFGESAADLEILYTSPESELAMRAIIRRIRTSNGVFALMVAFPQADWTANKDTVDNILKSFKP